VKEQSKKALMLSEGLTQMRKKGYRATSVDEIIKSLGIPKGTFYYYFKSKEEFTVEVLQHYTSNMYGHMEERLKNHEISPVSRIIGLYSEYIDQYVNSSVIGYGNFATKIVQEVGDEYPAIRTAANEIFTHIKMMHYKCLEEARLRGAIRKDTDTDKLAEFIIYAWEGALNRMKSTGNVKSLVVFLAMLRNILA
jgi:TetR/AcrR family transcriptional regulator, transcriptional repressor for nem operon